MRNFYLGLAVLIGLSVAAKADDGMHGGWCPTDGWVYQLNWLPSWTCEVDANGNITTCTQDYECIQLYMICRTSPPRFADHDPMEVDRQKRQA